MLKEICDEESKRSKRVMIYLREINMNSEIIKTKSINEIKKHNKIARHRKMEDKYGNKNKFNVI